MGPRLLTVVIEYSADQQRVTVRGVWPKDECKRLPPLAEGNQQNYVTVGEGVDMGWLVGFSGLTPVTEA